MINSINPTYNNRTRFVMNHTSAGRVVAKEPLNFRKISYELTRHPDRYGIFLSMSETLIFIDNGADYLRMIYEMYGINSEVSLIIEIKHPNTDKWESYFKGSLDFSTYSREQNRVSIKIGGDSTGYELLKSREATEIEPSRTETLDKAALNKQQTIDLELKPRKIFLQSKLVNSELNQDGEPLQIVTTWPFHATRHKVEVNSDQERIIETTFNTSGNTNVGFNIPADPNGVFPQNQQFFYFRNDRPKLLKIKVKWRVKIGFANSSVPSQFVRLFIQRSTYNENQSPEPVERHILYEVNGNGGLQSQTFEFETPSFTGINIQESECLALVFSVTEPVGGGNNFITIEESTIVIEEDSFFEATTTKAILNFEMAQRLLEIITGKPDILYSDTLGRTDLGYPEDGPASLVAFAHGMWIRQFEDSPEDSENRFKPLKTSFKDYFESISSTFNLGMGIEYAGFKERIRIEEKTYFFNKNITIKLGKAKNIKRSVATEYYHSKIEAGYSKGGEYDEAMGLDEYNAKAVFSTVIKKITTAFEVISKYRADSYGMEFARRKPRLNYPNEDTKYDQDIFIFDLKRFFNVFKQRLWQDDFEQEPIGVYSPETATNLRLSPVNTILRHGWYIASAFIKYPQDYIVFGSSTANAKLKTKLIGKPEFAENGDIQNSQLHRARFVPEWIEFEHPIDYEVSKQINGRSNINGKWIQNYYGMVEFINEENKKEYGFLFQVKFSGLGSFKLLKVHI